MQPFDLSTVVSKLFTEDQIDEVIALLASQRGRRLVCRVATVAEAARAANLPPETG